MWNRGAGFYQMHDAARCVTRLLVCYAHAVLVMALKQLSSAVLFVTLIALMSSCGRGAPLGPSLSNVALDGVRTQPTAGNPSLCCCHVVGSATNNNEVVVDVLIRFAAFDGEQNVPIGSLFYFIDDLQPRQRHEIDASGLFFSCSRVREIRSSVEVRSPQAPPP
jgi:hypothetical protein